ncbi:AraC family transcriptional regulator [Marinobacter salinexigens]|uniref:AraC family transcriptional regulator n=1 Tax=Marinobacter salinexigens TaxID=2919747 RepID=A0A5B0VAU0_9GAMM|nr:AraC family transcriptional regulator [Marinobacter salinexigens]KAA1171285.1 AraC family transcriptional regulator [Marinobacter salinexigens]
MPHTTRQTAHNALGDISILYATILFRAAEEEGADIEALKHRFKLSDATLSSPEARISISRFMRLGQAAIEMTGNPALGLHMGTLSRPVDYGLAGLAGASANTVELAFSSLIRYALLTSQNSRGSASIEQAERTVSFYSIRPYNRFNYFVVDSVLAAWTQFTRHLTGQCDVLEYVSIEYPSLGLDDLFEGWFRCPVRFDAPKNQVTFKGEIWSHPSLEAQPAMHSRLCEMCDTGIQQIKRGWTTGDRVKNLLTPMFRGETPGLETIAGKLGIAPWTLQRQLAREGTTFKALLDDTRKQLARDYIRETDSSLSETAWLLGFANPAAFHKAYRRWFGISPGEHRQQFRWQSERD